MVDKSLRYGDPYLNSPKEFHLETPLYHEFDLSIGVVAEKIHQFLCYSGTIDAYCVWCDKESVFDAYEYRHYTYQDWRRIDDEFERISYRCSRNSNHKYFIYYLKRKDSFQKIGQFPSVADFQIPQAEKYRKALGENQYKELTKGIGLAAHGVGIGSFVYVRRIFENLIEEAHAQAEKIEGFPEDKYANARMNEKIQLLRDFLPEFLVENRNLYMILSKGIHELSEEECLKYFQTIRIGIEQILDEKIEQKEKRQKAARAREAIQDISREVASKQPPNETDQYTA